MLSQPYTYSEVTYKHIKNTDGYIVQIGVPLYAILILKGELYTEHEIGELLSISYKGSF